MTDPFLTALSNIRLSSALLLRKAIEDVAEAGIIIAFLDQRLVLGSLCWGC